MTATSLLSIMPLGAGNEVGRSSILVSFKGKNILLDCGMHPAYSGISSLPFFDAIDPGQIDVLLVTHFHLDHIASLPYLMQRTAFKGKVYMTHPTKAIYKWLLLDLIKISNSPNDVLFDEEDLQNSYERILAIDYHQEIDAGDGIRFTAFHAGHVLGAAMFMIELAGTRVLYTGDYSRELDRHLKAAEKPPGPSPLVMICEATYGVQSHEPQAERERRFTSRVHEIVARGGRCLLPVFALGKAHELLMILDEYWDKHPELTKVPIYYASSLTKKCLSIYSTYLHMMAPAPTSTSSSIQGASFNFRHVTSVRGNAAELVHGLQGSCVMMASPGMLQSGLSRELLEAWCGSPLNGLILTGYSVEGTLAKTLLSGEPSEISALATKRSLPFRMTVESISFSAHVDFCQNAHFIEEIAPEHLVLVHGEYNEMMRLRNTIQLHYELEDSTSSMKVYTPRNCETVEIVVGERRVARAAGAVLSAALGNLSHPGEELPIETLALVDRNWEMTLIDPEDINAVAPTLKKGTSSGSIQIDSLAPWSLIFDQIAKLVGKGVQIQHAPSSQLLHLLDGEITVLKETSSSLVVSWRSSAPLVEMLADAIVALVLSLDGSPAAVRLQSAAVHSHVQSDEPIDPVTLAGELLANYYERVEMRSDGIPGLEIYLEGEKEPYLVDFGAMDVRGSNPRTEAHIRQIIRLHNIAVGN